MRGQPRFAILAVCMLLVAPVVAEEILVGGRVLLPDGQPLPQAEVRLLPLSDALGGARAAWEGRAEEPATQALTDDD